MSFFDISPLESLDCETDRDSNAVSIPDEEHFDFRPGILKSSVFVYGSLCSNKFELAGKDFKFLDLHAFKSESCYSDFVSCLRSFSEDFSSKYSVPLFFYKFFKDYLGLVRIGVCDGVFCVRLPFCCDNFCGDAAGCSYFFNEMRLFLFNEDFHGCSYFVFNRSSSDSVWDVFDDSCNKKCFCRFTGNCCFLKMFLYVWVSENLFSDDSGKNLPCDVKAVGIDSFTADFLHSYLVNDAFFIRFGVDSAYLSAVSNLLLNGDAFFYLDDDKETEDKDEDALSGFSEPDDKKVDDRIVLYFLWKKDFSWKYPVEIDSYFVRSLVLNGDSFYSACCKKLDAPIPSYHIFSDLLCVVVASVYTLLQNGRFQDVLGAVKKEEERLSGCFTFPSDVVLSRYLVVCDDSFKIGKVLSDFKAFVKFKGFYWDYGFVGLDFSVCVSVDAFLVKMCPVFENSMNSANKNIFFISGISRFLDLYHCVVSEGKERGSYFCHAFNSFVMDYDRHVVVLAGSSGEVESFFDEFPNLRCLFFKRFDFFNDDVETLYNKIAVVCGDSFMKSFSLAAFCDWYASFCKQNILVNERFVHWFSDYYKVYHKLPVFDKSLVALPDKNPEVMLADLIGMEDLKLKINKFKDYVSFCAKVSEKGVCLSQNFHMVFRGNPGVGKTTVARIIANILYRAGICRKNLCLETDATCFIGEYVGSTAPKTKNLLTSALGGVLFIDEAYSLMGHSGTHSDFSADFFAVLVKFMEDHKDDLIIIFAGYPDEMDSFLSANPGLRSRIGYIFDFPDYTVDELVSIFKLKLQSCKFEADDDVIATVRDCFARHAGKKGFGNGRFVGSVFDRIVVEHSTNYRNHLVPLLKIGMCDLSGLP